MGKIIAQNKTSQTAQNTNLTDLTNGLLGQFVNEPDIQAIVGSGYAGVLNAIGSSAAGFLQSLAAQAVNRIVYRDNPQLNQNLSSVNLQASIEEVLRQMKAQGASVLAMTIGATPATPRQGSSFDATMNGNGVVNASVIRPFDGKVLENAYAENLTFMCLADSYAGSAVAGNEVFQVRGTGATSSVFNYDWPLGSNGNISISVIDGNTDNGAGNLLTNSGFNTWSAGALSKWTVINGGSQLTQESALSYDGASALKITGDGTTNIGLKQQFDSATGTTGTLSQTTQYSVNVFARRDGTAAGSGVLAVDLIDQNSNVVKDEAGNNNSFTIDLTALTVGYQNFVGSFRTPYIMPSTLSLRARISTALTSGRAVYLDKLSMGRMSQVYRHGPFVAAHAGSVPFRVGDWATCAITNSRGAGGTLNTFQCLAFRLFPLFVQNEYLLNSSSSPSLSDGLITA